MGDGGCSASDGSAAASTGSTAASSAADDSGISIFQLTCLVGTKGDRDSLYKADGSLNPSCEHLDQAMLGIVILAIVLLTIVLETGLSFIEERVHHSHNEVRKVLLEKFFKEFTMLGLIAFTLLFLEDKSISFFPFVSDAVSYDYHRMHLLFEFGHFLILFMALAFVQRVYSLQ